MHDILQFHRLHGTAVVLSEGGAVATRCGDFCHGIAFSSQPLKVGQKVCLELTQSSEWSGALRLGVTFHDPAKLNQRDLPRYACPDLTNKEGYWARGLHEKYAESGNRITFYVNGSGQMHYFVNNEHKGMLLNHLPTTKRLWALFDIYGNTSSAKLVHADEAPVEIVARGTEALRAYQLACESGTQPVFRTRLMLVGQDRVGKTSLKKALTGQSHNREEPYTEGIDLSVWCSLDRDTATSSTPRTPHLQTEPYHSHNRQEESTDGIDLSASCSFNLRDRRTWKLAVEGAPAHVGDRNTGLTDDSTGQLDSVTLLCGLEGLEEEYHRAIATNIVQELLYQRRCLTTQPSLDSNSSTNSSSAPDKKSGSGSSHKKTRTGLFSGKKKEVQGNSAGQQPTQPSNDFKSTSDSVKSGELLLQEMPDRVVELVDELLHEKETAGVTSPTPPGTHSGANIVLNIWDFAGQAAYYTTHQVFLSSRAVYIIVFNLCHDLTQTTSLGDTGQGVGMAGAEMTHLEYMDLWMHSIHTHTAQNTRASLDNTTLSPPIFIVGTHRDSLEADPAVRARLVEEKFEQVRQMVKGKPYEKHIVSQLYAVENSLQDGDDEQIGQLRRHIEEIASKETYMGEQIPLKWLRLEQALNQMVEKKTFFSSLDQIEEVGKEVGLSSAEELKTVLEFYHDLGVIVYHGGPGHLDITLRNTVILQPQWLIDMFKCIVTTHDHELQQSGPHAELWHRLATTGLLEERLIDHVWADFQHQKNPLLALMHKFDLIAERLPTKTLTNRLTERLGRAFYVPSCIHPAMQPEDVVHYQPNKLDIAFYMDFNGFLPDGLYHRMVTRAVRWSQECGGHEPTMHYRQVRFFLDSEHDFLLQMASPAFARIKVVIVRVVDLDDTEEDDSSDSGTEKPLPAPKPHACAKVRNFLESTLSDLRELWMKRISYQACVPCWCDRQCVSHGITRCQQESCIHFLSLDECLANKVVCCEHRRVKTAPYRKWFPAPPPVVRTGPVLSESVIKQVGEQTQQGNIEASTQGVDLPPWCKSAAKLLNGGSEGQDWFALAKKLGYKKNKVEKLGDDMNPGLALITDWIISSGNTPLSVDMLLSCLEQLHRDDIVDIIHKGQECEEEARQVFISYQWDSQDEVSLLRDRLEKAGYTCWMDIGQMGGGDHLYARIDEGIRNAKMVIACVSPKYVVSHHCHRELGLADLLRKPILPVMYERVPWPPPGAMALVFASLCYIDMKGVGGHGGSGIHADLESKHQEIIQRISNYTTPASQPPADTSSNTDPSIRRGGGLDAFALDSSLHSGESLQSYSPQPADTLLIPGYSSDQSNSLRLTGGTTAGQAGRGSLPTGPSGGVAGSSAGGNVPLAQVEQVHVTKCAVCTIL